MIRNELINLIRASLAQGKKEKELTRGLHRAGWPARDIWDTMSYVTRHEKIILRIKERPELSLMMVFMVVGVALLLAEVWGRLQGFSFFALLFS